MNLKRNFIVTILLFLTITHTVYSDEVIFNDNSIDIQAVETSSESRYPDYSKMYLGDDKYESFNRKMFNLNTKLNKFLAKPVHIVWSSIMPKFGMDRIKNAYDNIEYPKRLVSCIMQKDGQAIKKETLRFLTNTTIGLGGMFDPADKIFKVKPTNENMEQALCKCKMKSGSYLVMPCLHSCTPRTLCGRALEAALDPVIYLGSPVISIVKAGLMINKTSYMQQLAEMIESNYADPYDIHKKLFGLENYIKNANLDRDETLLEEKQLAEEGKFEAAEKLIAQTGDKPAPIENNITENTLNILTKQDSKTGDIVPLGESALKADICLANFNPQTPVVDSMRTALFENPSVNKSIWNELSVWNRSFAKRIKTGSVLISENKPEYKFKYILQKDKTAPVIILYPSIGEGAGTHHSIIFAKEFYDEGYSVVMQGNHFQWEFAKSMPDGYYPGIPLKDAEKIRMVTEKILDNLSKKYDCEFKEKTLVGTSFGAMAALFVADIESKDNKLNIHKYIAISPPIDLKFALKQADKNAEEFDKNSVEVKQKTAATAAKILQLSQLKSEGNLNIETMPFSDEEGKLITTFILRQKLSDLIFTLENIPKNKKTDIYETINNMSYTDYAEKYLGLDPIRDYERFYNEASLFGIKNYLSNSNNYKIYHSLDDYFINKEQLSKLKEISGKNLVCLNCGSHLGYLYRKEFEEALKNDLKR